MEHEVTTHELTGGAKLLAVNVPNAISCYFRTSVRAGHRFCSNDIYEVPHILEHLAFEGTKSFPDPLGFKSAIERLGAAYNASTSVDAVNYWFIVGAEHLGSIADIALSQVLEPLFLAERVDQQKAVVINELTRRVDSDGINRSYYNHQLIFPSINPSWEDRIEMTERITVDDVKKVYSETYGTSNMRFVVAGDLGKKQLRALITKLNIALKNKPVGKEKLFKPLEPSSDWRQKVQVLPSNIPSVDHFYMRFCLPEYDLDSRVGLHILMVMYAAGLGSRMQMKAREAGLTYTFGAGAYTEIDMTDFALYDQVPPAKLQPLFELAMQELSDLKACNYSDEEWDRAREFTIGSIKRSIQTPAEIAAGYSGNFLRDEPLESPQEFIDRINLATRADVKRVADKYLTGDNWVLTLVGQKLGGQESAFAEIVRRHFS